MYDFVPGRRSRLPPRVLVLRGPEMRSLAVTIAVLLILSVPFSSAQTIHEDDIDYFVGSFARTDSLDRESIDCSRFVEWLIIRPKPGERIRDFRQIKYSWDKHWVFSHEASTRQDGELKWNRYRRDLQDFTFFIMMV